jgi:hypothetical protein
LLEHATVRIGKVTGQISLSCIGWAVGANITLAHAWTFCKPFIPAKFYEHTPILQQGREVSAAMHGVLFTRFATLQCNSPPWHPFLVSSMLVRQEASEVSASFINMLLPPAFKNGLWSTFQRLEKHRSNMVKLKFGLPTRLLTGLQQKMDSRH